MSVRDDLRALALDLAGRRLVDDDFERRCIRSFLVIADSYFEHPGWARHNVGLPLDTLAEWLLFVVPWPDGQPEPGEAERQCHEIVSPGGLLGARGEVRGEHSPWQERVVAYVREQMAAGYGAQTVIRASAKGGENGQR